MSKFVLHLFRLVVALFVLFGATFPARSAGEAEVYTLGVIPAAPPVTLHKLWTPVIDRLSKDTGIEFRLKLYDRMAEFEREIGRGTPDFIFSSPIQLVVARQSAGYIPLVRDNKLIDIGLFVRQDSPIRSIDDLAGKKISFVGNKNICSVYMQHLLMSHGKDLSFEREYAGSTKNVLLNVLLGKVDAGAALSPEMERAPEETRAQLREVVSTPKFTPHPLSAHPRVPAPVREAVKKALLNIAASPESVVMLKAINLSNLVEANYQKDYSKLEEIDIKGLTNWGE